MSRTLEYSGNYIASHPWTVILPLMMVLAANLAIASFAYFGQAEVSQRVTTIEESPCIQNPRSKTCIEYRARVLKHEPLHVSCIVFRRTLPDPILRYTRCI